MTPRGQIITQCFLAVVFGFNTYTNWSMYNWDQSPPLTTMRVINMVTMPTLTLLSLGQVLKWLTAPKAERVLDPHATIVIEESPIGRACRWLTLAIFTGAGAWGLIRGDARLGAFDGISLFSILILGIGAWGLVALAFNPRQRMTMTPQSLTDSRLRPGIVAWEELSDVQSKTFWGTTTLTLVLRDDREFRSSSPLARWRRVDRLKVTPITFGVEADVLRQGIELRRNVFTF
jgi:hypothetical protein